MNKKQIIFYIEQAIQKIDARLHDMRELYDEGDYNIINFMEGRKSAYEEILYILQTKESKG